MVSRHRRPEGFSKKEKRVAQKMPSEKRVLLPADVVARATLAVTLEY